MSHSQYKLNYNICRDNTKVEQAQYLYTYACLTVLSAIQKSIEMFLSHDLALNTQFLPSYWGPLLSQNMVILIRKEKVYSLELNL